MAVNSSVELDFVNQAGVVVGKIVIFASRSGDVVVVPADECEEFGEESVQLLEGRTYEYSLQCGSNLSLATRSGTAFITPSSNPSLINCGRLETRDFVGRLPLYLENAEEGEQIASVTVEVRSQKMGYRDDVRSMLSDIADGIVALALDYRSPTELRIRPDPKKTATSLYQQYALIAGILRSGQFYSALNQIVSRPNSLLTSEAHDIPVGRIGKIDRPTLKQLVSKPGRALVPSTHPIASFLPTVATRVRTQRRVVGHDTPENQFVLFVLEQFLGFLGAVVENLQSTRSEESQRLVREAQALIKGLSVYRANPVFSRLSRLGRIPFDSPVLQRRAGYREILHAWIRFDVSASLEWKGAEDVFGAGQLNTPLLYEYWVFFKLLSLIRAVCDFPRVEIAKLFALSKDGMAVSLRRGKNATIYGSLSAGSTILNVRFDYNRTFKWSPKTFAPGSWTRTLRPDYTFSVWKAEFSEQEAESNGSIAHLHFDAKYRLDGIGHIFRVESESLSEEEISESDSIEDVVARSSPKATDLLKMHAYRDAIRRSVGSYVIYPGNQTVSWTEFHEILPGLGAFTMKPSKPSASLEQFIRDFLVHYASGSVWQGVADFKMKSYGRVHSTGKKIDE
jgi:predicted component of viral defense system (DUF524 family)